MSTLAAEFARRGLELVEDFRSGHGTADDDRTGGVASAQRAGSDSLFEVSWTGRIDRDGVLHDVRVPGYPIV